MQTISIHFYKSKHGKLYDKLISLFTFGPYSHVEMNFGFGKSFSSSPRDGGVRFKNISYEKGKWDSVLIEVDREQQSIMEKFCQEQVGKNYDFLGCFGVFFRVFRGPKRKWFCSEVIAAALQSVNILNSSEKYHYISPSKLYKLVSAI